MTVQTFFQSLIPQELNATVISIVVSLLAVAAVVVLIIVAIKCRKKVPGVSKKPTIELNEQQFKDNIELARGNEPADTATAKEKDTKYMQFNDEEFVEGVPRRAE